MTTEPTRDPANDSRVPDFPLDGTREKSDEELAQLVAQRIASGQPRHALTDVITELGFHTADFE